MIYVLYSTTGTFEDYRENPEYYFTNEHDAEKVLEKLLKLNEFLRQRTKGLKYSKADRIIEAAYKKIGVITYTNDFIGWFVRPLKCGNALECLR